ncbi:ComF family protein [Psychrobacter sp. I-STPA10]|uniref:ComF family protein n=1 Tax=Psychrobacter sp. I-STPA10 TaxID=2585769 RepID=UPI001E5ED9DE|nr:ComF family protein [Psychrobacter sp. I-STPA10]
MPPYQLGLWFNQYVRQTCILCQTPYGYANLEVASKQNFVRVWIKQRQMLICMHCHQDIHWRPQPFTINITPHLQLDIISAAAYKNCIRRAIIAFKYREDLSSLPLLIHAIRQLPRPHGCHTQNSCILPMPTTTARLRYRGFDPVFILAKYLAQHWQIPLWQGAVRIHDTGRQQGLSKEARLLNVQGAFALTQSPKVRHIILFDDVATTGASLKALAQPFEGLNRQVKLLAYTLAHGSS